MTNIPQTQTTDSAGISDRVVFFALGFLLTMAIIISLTAFFEFGRWWVFGNPDFAPWLDGFFQNAGTEFLGALLTFYLIETLLRKRRQADAKYADTTAEERRLILQMGSPDNAFAIEAARQLRARGWVRDGSLQGANLAGANLQGASLGEADLRRARLVMANLQQAYLADANLEHADLNRADLRGAQLLNANLQGARLYGANMQGVTLVMMNLRGADLRSARLGGAELNSSNLQEADFLGANLKDAKLDHANLQGARLPDGTTLPNNEYWEEAMALWWSSNQYQLETLWKEPNPFEL